MAIDIEADKSISTNIDRKEIPRAQMFITAIREIGEKQPDNEEFYETSDEVLNLKELLRMLSTRLIYREDRPDLKNVQDVMQILTMII